MSIDRLQSEVVHIPNEQIDDVKWSSQLDVRATPRTSLSSKLTKARKKCYKFFFSYLFDLLSNSPITCDSISTEEVIPARKREIALNRRQSSKKERLQSYNSAQLVLSLYLVRTGASIKARPIINWVSITAASWSSTNSKKRGRTTVPPFMWASINSV